MSWGYFYILFQSNFVEVLVFLFFYRKYLSAKESVLLVSLSNCLTHPIVFFVFLKSKMTYLEAILSAETFAILSEAVLHRIGGIDWKRAFAASLFANFASWQLGPIFTTLIFLSDRV